MALVIFFLAFNCLLVGGYLHYRWRHGSAGAAPLPRRMTAAARAARAARAAQTA